MRSRGDAEGGEKSPTENASGALGLAFWGTRPSDLQGAPVGAFPLALQNAPTGAPHLIQQEHTEKEKPSTSVAFPPACTHGGLSLLVRLLHRLPGDDARRDSGGTGTDTFTRRGREPVRVPSASPRGEKGRLCHQIDAVFQLLLYLCWARDAGRLSATTDNWPWTGVSSTLALAMSAWRRCPPCNCRKTWLSTLPIHVPVPVPVPGLTINQP